MAVASLVLGIIALVTSILPIINNLSFIMAILGVVFGIVGIVGVMHGKKSGKGLAVAGLVLSVVAFVLVLVMQSAFSAAFDAALEENGLSTSTEQSAAAGQDDSASTAPAADGADAAASAESAPAAEYAVSIDGCRVTEDYEGNPAAVITYTFTNNSEEATSPAVALHEKVFQNGVQLEMAIGTDSEDGGKSMNEVKPGASITYELSYALEDESDITVEVEELISFSDEVLAEKTFSVA